MLPVTIKQLTTVDAFDECVRKKEPILLSNHSFDIMKIVSKDVAMLLARRIGTMENEGWLYTTRLASNGHEIILYPPKTEKQNDKNLIKGKLSIRSKLRLKLPISL